MSTSYARAADDPGYWRFSEDGIEDPTQCRVVRAVAFHAASAYQARDLTRRYFQREIPNKWTLVDVGDVFPVGCEVLVEGP